MTSYCWNRRAGEDAFKLRDYGRALTSFSEAISLHANKSKYFGSRCLCYGKLCMRSESADDARKAIIYNVDNVDLKDIAGSIERAEALLGLDDMKGARDAVEKGLHHTNSGSAELLELAEQISTLTLNQKGYK